MDHMINVGDRVVVLLLSGEQLKGDVVYKPVTPDGYWIIKHRDESIFYLKEYQYICKTKAVM